MNVNDKVNYLEFPARDMEATKTFFGAVFGWNFEDYGPDYAAFSDAGIDGGFFRSELAASTEHGSVLVVLYSDAIEQVQERIQSAGGKISRAIFPFPGGRRFHFIEPSGNELAVWTDVGD